MALDFSHRSHIKHYFHSETRSYEPGADFCVEIGECLRRPESGFAESVKAAQLIYEGSQDKKLALCMSGGIDSECMAQAFLAAQIPFTVYILRFANSLNWFDIRDAVQFCEAHRIPFHYIDLDIIDFFESGEFLDYAKKYRCISPQLSAHLHLIANVEGTPILSWNPTAVYFNNKKEIFYYLPTDLYFCYERFFETNRREGVGHFFLYTPELFYSLLRTPVMQNLILQRGPGQGFESSYWTKCQTYKQSGFRARPRDDKKTGFEVVKKLFAEKYKKPEEVFNELFRLPLEKMFPPPPRNIRRISKKWLYEEQLA